MELRIHRERPEKPGGELLLVANEGATINISE